MSSRARSNSKASREPAKSFTLRLWSFFGFSATPPPADKNNVSSHTESNSSSSKKKQRKSGKSKKSKHKRLGSKHSKSKGSANQSIGSINESTTNSKPSPDITFISKPVEKSSVLFHNTKHDLQEPRRIIQEPKQMTEQHKQDNQTSRHSPSIPTIPKPTLPNITDSLDTTMDTLIDEAAELAKALLKQVENKSQEIVEEDNSRDTRKRKSRFKKYERTKRRIIINPSSESELEVSKSESLAPKSSHVVELVENGSRLFHSFEDSMISALMEEKINLEQALKNQPESVDIEEVPSQSEEEEIIEGRERVYLKRAANLHNKPVAETSSHIDVPSTVLHKSVVPQESAVAQKSVVNEANNKQATKLSINVKRIKLTGSEALALRKPISFGLEDTDATQSGKSISVYRGLAFGVSAEDKMLLLDTQKVAQVHIGTRQENLFPQNNVQKIGTLASVSFRSMENTAVPYQVPLHASGTRSLMPLGVSSEDRAPEAELLSISTDQNEEIPLLKITKRSRLNKKRKPHSRVAYRLSKKNEHLPLREVLDATLLKEAMSNETNETAFNNSSQYLTPLDTLVYIQPSIESILPPSRDTGNEFQLQITSTPTKTVKNSEIKESPGSESLISMRSIKTSQNPGELQDRTKARKVQETPSSQSLAPQEIRSSQKSQNSQDSRNLHIQAQAFVATQTQKMEQPTRNMAKTDNTSNISIDGSQYLIPPKLVLLTPKEISFSYIQEPTRIEACSTNPAPKDQTSSPANLSDWPSSQSRVLFDSTIIPESSQSEKIRSQISIGGSQMISIASQSLNGESQEGSYGNMQKLSNTGVNSSFDTSSLSQRTPSRKWLRRIQITPMAASEQVKRLYEQAGRKFDGFDVTFASE